MSLDAIGIVSRNTALSVRFYGLLGVDLKEKGSPDHLEGTTRSGVRSVKDPWIGIVAGWFRFMHQRPVHTKGDPERSPLERP